ncbi:MAG: hypothetical protein A2583_09570 [Bdellovibrionales bacterium RIFOXYD1_FULL_53_11]|nr:MAG: hypothetical protein A2583_09570 [Bdellovibrionales bacterium RIFOXYD1_FULL_53_11]
MLRLAAPAALVFLGQMTMGFTGIVALGRVSAPAVSAAGMGASVFGWFMVFGLGILSSLDFFVSHANGAGRKETGYEFFIQGLIIAAAVSIPLITGIAFLSYNLDWFGTNPDLIPDAASFLRILSFSMPLVLLYSVCRQYLQAYSVIVPTVITLIGANVLNAFLTWIFVFGKFGLAPMGAEGSAWSILISRVILFIALAAYLLNWDRQKGGALIGRVQIAFDRAKSVSILKLGLPAALQMVIEVGVFAIVTMLSASLDANSAAAHQIVLNAVSMTFMVPLGISSAAAVLVGRETGKENYAEAARMGWRALKIGAGFMAASGIVLAVFPSSVLAIYTHDAVIARAAGSIILIGALFQLFDGVQVVATGVLRGIAETRKPMIANLVCYWFLGLPLGWWLCFRNNSGIAGLWAGLAIAIAAISIWLLAVWIFSSRSLFLKSHQRL